MMFLFLQEASFEKVELVASEWLRCTYITNYSLGETLCGLEQIPKFHWLAYARIGKFKTPVC